VKRQIAMALIVSLALSGTAWAQGGREGRQELPECRPDLSFNAERCIQARRAEAERLNPSAPEDRIRSQKLAVAGLITALVGTAMVIPQGDTYHVFGDAVCVNTYSIDHGSCESLAPRIGLIALGGGIAMMVVGTRKVTVKPYASKNVKGATATIAWGGNR